MKYKSGLPLIYQMVKTMMPAVRRELAGWRLLAARIPDAELRAQAMASLSKKSFHCLGGCVYALYPNADFECTVKFIVAFQTISDYLDNLCDRAGVFDEAAFRLLHRSMLDAVDPDAAPGDYYALYPRREDGGYLNALVEACREEARKLPSIRVVREKMKQLVSYYSELQALKHMEPSQRESALESWAGPHASEYPEITVWEFCSAAGSTLGVFLLFAAAQHPALTDGDVDALLGAYFPWVCALHILLDYFIDAEEDRREGDFNFTSYYSNDEVCLNRLRFFVDQSIIKCSVLSHSGFHLTVIRGLLALYLSDEKALSGGNKKTAVGLIRHGGRKTLMYHKVCNALRALGKL